MTLLTHIESGSPADPAVVFLHAGPLSCKMWRPQLEFLEDDFYCLAPDMPGHGGSIAEGPFALEAAARRVTEFIQAKVPGGKASLVGISLGGAVALTLLRLNPGVVERVMVSGTAAKLGRFTGQLSLAMLPLLRFMPVDKQAEMTLKQLGVPAESRDLVWDDFVQGATPAYNRLVLQALMEMELPTQINCPLLVAVGENETPPARQAAQKLLAMYQRAEGIRAPGLHHLWNLQDPELFSKTVQAFVMGVSLPEQLDRIK